MSYEGWLTDGTTRHVQDDTMYIKRFGTFDPFAWMGVCARVDEGTEALGDISSTNKRDPRGGLQTDSVQRGAPGITTDTLVIKKLQYDRMKTDLKNCWWILDQRTTCNGGNADGWNDWQEIIRRCQGGATGRTTPASAFDGENVEQLVQFAWSSLYSEDLYRVVGEIGDPTLPTAKAVIVTAVTGCQPSRCPDICDDQEDCIVIAVTEDDGATPYFIVNRYGGDIDAWDTEVAFTAWGTEDALDVACAGDFFIAVSNDAGAIIYSDDLGTTQVEVTTTDMTAHQPNCVDMVNQSFIVIGGDDGYVFISYDAGRTWVTADAGNATTQDLTAVMIARDNPQIIYLATNAADVVVKTENGGRTWYATGATGMAGTGPTSLFATNQTHVLVGSDAGEIWETSDGGVNWTQQTELPGLTTKANTTISAITGCGCGDLGLTTLNSSDDESFFYRNVDVGASGKWVQPANYEAVAAGYSLQDVTCCGASHFVAVGGDAGIAALEMLLR